LQGIATPPRGEQGVQLSLESIRDDDMDSSTFHGVTMHLIVYLKPKEEESEMKSNVIGLDIAKKMYFMPSQSQRPVSR